MFMEENICLQNKSLAQQTAKKAVDAFLSKHHFIRTFPLNFIDLADKIGGFKIYYLSEKNDFFNKAVGAISPTMKQIALHPRFNVDHWHFLMGRYILAKLFARYALQTMPPGKVWIEMENAFRTEEDLRNTEEVANFAFELLMPAEEFNHQWALLGKDVKKLALYFEVADFKIVERAQFLGLSNAQEN